MTQIVQNEEEKESEDLPVGLNPEYRESLKFFEGINESSTFNAFMSKEEITNVIFINSDPKKDILKFATTSNDGFIKLNEIDLKNEKFICRKSLFVS